MTWLIPAVLMIALFVAFRRMAVFRRLAPEWGAIGAAVIVIVSSVYELATAAPESIRSRLYAALLGAMVVVVIVAGTRRLRRA